MRIRVDLIPELKRNKDLRIDLFPIFRVTEGRTIREMFERNDPKLLRKDALEAISKHTGIDVDNLVES